MNSQALFQANGVSKSYGGVTVLDRVSLTIAPGEVHALLGANGAGKSTLSKIIAGLVRPTTGHLVLSGTRLNLRNKRDAEKVGIEIVQQELNLIPTLTVAENLFLANLPNVTGIVRYSRLNNNAKVLLQPFGLGHLDVTTKVERLGVGQQQMLEIAAAFGRKCKLLILDEPTAALSAAEAAMLFDQVARLRASGASVVYISHRLEEIRRICDRVTILRDGCVVASGATNEMDQAAIVRYMSGQGTSLPNATRQTCDKLGHLTTPGQSNHLEDDRRQLSTAGSPKAKFALRVDHLVSKKLNDISFCLHFGERLGIAGLVGSGRTSLLRAIFGADRVQSGQIFISGSSEGLRFHHPSQAINSGIALVTEDRKQNGLLLSNSISTNMTLSSLASGFSNMGVVDRIGERKIAREMIDRMNIKCNSEDQNTGTLSGGNQQKVVVAKWLVRNPDVLMLDEPTRGIDVSARSSIHNWIAELASNGKAILIVSSDMDELFEVCDRILVLSRGRLTKEIQRADFSRESIVEASFE